MTEQCQLTRVTSTGRTSAARRALKINYLSPASLAKMKKVLVWPGSKSGFPRGFRDSAGGSQFTLATVSRPNATLTVTLSLTHVLFRDSAH